MKARIKATGEIVEVSANRVYYTTTTPNRRGHYECTEIEILDDPDYWTRLEHQYAGMAMQGILACEEWKISPREGVSFAGEVALQAHELATALVQKLKEKEERK